MNPLVLIATYNEKDNVENLFHSIRSLNLNLDIVFFDDNSPDGTGRIIDQLVNDYDNTYAVHRPSKDGVGSAHQTGISWASSHGYAIVITMDCDFTHGPHYLPTFLEQSMESDVVVGSRFIDDSNLDGWSQFRRGTTHLANILTSILLRLPYDATSGFRLYRLTKDLEKTISGVRSPGYSFFFESLYRLNQDKFLISEISVILPPRTQGNSKMTLSDAWDSLRTLMRLYFSR